MQNEVTVKLKQQDRNQSSVEFRTNVIIVIRTTATSKHFFFPQICKEIVTPVKKGDRNYQAIFIRNFSSAQL